MPKHRGKTSKTQKDLMKKLAQFPGSSSFEDLLHGILHTLDISPLNAAAEKERMSILKNYLVCFTAELQKNLTEEAFKAIELPIPLLCRLLALDVGYHKNVIEHELFQICYTSCTFDERFHLPLLQSGLINLLSRTYRIEKYQAYTLKLIAALCLQDEVLQTYPLMEHLLRTEPPFFVEAIRPENHEILELFIPIFMRLTSAPNPRLMAQITPGLFTLLKTYPKYQDTIYCILTNQLPYLSESLTLFEMEALFSAFKHEGANTELLIDLIAKFLVFSGVPELVIHLKGIPRIISLLSNPKTDFCALHCLTRLITEKPEIHSMVFHLGLIPKLETLLSSPSKRTQYQTLKTMNALSADLVAAKIFLTPPFLPKLFEFISLEDEHHLQLQALTVLESSFKHELTVPLMPGELDILVKRLDRTNPAEINRKVTSILVYGNLPPHPFFHLNLIRHLFDLNDLSKDPGLILKILNYLTTLSSHPMAIPQLQSELGFWHLKILKYSEPALQSAAAKLILTLASNDSLPIKIETVKMMQVLLEVAEPLQGLLHLIQDPHNAKLLAKAGGISCLLKTLASEKYRELAIPPLLNLVRKNPNLLPIGSDEAMRPFVHLLNHPATQDEVAFILLKIASRHHVTIDSFDEMNLLIRFLSHPNQKLRHISMLGFANLASHPRHAAMISKGGAIEPLIKALKIPTFNPYAQRILSLLMKTSDEIKEEIDKSKRAFFLHHAVKPKVQESAPLSKEMRVITDEEKRRKKAQKILSKTEALKTEILSLAHTLSEDPKIEVLTHSDPRQTYKNYRQKKQELTEKVASLKPSETVSMTKEFTDDEISYDLDGTPPCAFDVFSITRDDFPEEVMRILMPWKQFALKKYPGEVHLALVGSQVASIRAGRPFHPNKDWDFELFCLSDEPLMFEEIKKLFQDFGKLTLEYSNNKGYAIYLSVRIPHREKFIDLNITIYQKNTMTIEKCIENSQIDRRLSHRAEIYDLDTSRLYTASEQRCFTKYRAQLGVQDYGYAFYDLARERLKIRTHPPRPNSPQFQYLLRELKKKSNSELHNIFKYAKKRLTKKFHETKEPFSHAGINACLKALYEEYGLNLTRHAVPYAFFQQRKIEMPHVIPCATGGPPF